MLEDILMLVSAHCQHVMTALEANLLMVLIVKPLYRLGL